MEYLSLGLVLDCLIVILLIATITYSARLAIYLKRFKNNRDELQGIITELSQHIDKANQAVESLHEAADEAGHDLQARINKASQMGDELNMMVQSGDVLANRLEDLAIKNRKIIDGGEGDLDDLRNATKSSARDDENEYEARVQNLINDVSEDDQGASKKSPFMIRDPELERGDKGDQSNGGFTLDNDDVLSDAERDLYDALQKKKNQKKASGKR